MQSWMAKQKAKALLQQAFKSGGLFKEYSYGKSKGYIYPKIKKITFDKINQSLNYDFTLPVGLDPKEVSKKAYIFNQVFGDKLALKGDTKYFTLTIFAAVLPDIMEYDYSTYTSILKDLSLPILTGLDLNGKIIAYDMVKNPHLLIAGETGSGKSTQLRSVLTTLILTLPPNRLELYLCDLKRGEFHIFRGIEHVQGLFVSAKEMLPMLRYLQKEMQVRGDLLDQYEVAHIDDLPTPLPYIVLGIDEVALLQDQKEIMGLIEEISAIGRALGIFLILSMQRPDSKILDGKLKNNLTVRMGFRCADRINSRIIGTPGSEKLTEEGTMLFKIPRFIELTKIKAPFLSLDKAKEILSTHKNIKGKNSKKQPSKRFEKEIETKEIETNIFEVLDL